MPQLNQAAKRDLARRGLISDTVLSLIGRAKGLDLLHFNEGLDKSVRLVGEDGDVGPLIEDGYEFAGFDQRVSGHPMIKLERLDGLFYPVSRVAGYWLHQDKPTPEALRG